MAISRSHALFIITPGLMVVSLALMTPLISLAGMLGWLGYSINNAAFFAATPSICFALMVIGAHLCTAGDDEARELYEESA